MQSWKRALLPLVSPLFPFVITLAQRYMRGDVDLGKRLVWSRLIEPRLSARPYRFRCETLFGASLTGDTVDIQQRYVYYFGLWEPNLTDWIARSLRPGDGFIDVGANVGYFSLLASRLVGPSGCVVAIEASPEIYRALTENIALNEAWNVRAVNLAVSDGEGTLPIYRGPAEDSGLTTTIPYLDFLRYEGTVPARTLPAVCSTEEIAAARIVKIDVEGAEAAVVGGMRRLLEDGRADLEIAIEINAARLTAAGRRAEEIFDIFEGAGFHSYRLRNDYTSAIYLPPRTIARPERLRTREVADLYDYIFSRRDAEVL